MAKRSKNTSKRPRSDLKRKSWLLEGTELLIIVILIVALFCVSAIQTLVIRGNQAASVVSAVLVDLANGDRVSNSVGGLTINPQLVAAAQAKADDMAKRGYFAHSSPEGYDSWHWFKKVGYQFSYAGENLAVDFVDSADVERAWMNSPTHRGNLLDPHFTEIGIATAEGVFEGRPTTFVVQMFGAPAGASEVATPVREIAAPQDATAIAVATTEPTTNVLGTSAEQAQAPIAHAGETHPIAAVTAPSGKAPAGAIKQYAPMWGFLATSPKTTLRWAYYAVGLLVLLALLITTGLELRWHHRRAFTVAFCLLVFMSGLFVVADLALFSEPVLADSTISP
ncbi:hypothetical protein A2704_03405 [Candidatus Kaiserbacteria bacterium RIFCSPHIGHO2_01_FULL_54_36b]|uniref:SCP domain-containing protein n=1 Tax=Candidatus Kaiserbacteria bacterium RIFCSPHIGHO2_01_FULL_54_36b TaxID=1798483 RepID=A0A1F6CQD2_9BACT|nr:MAG: hypothetical protein A2704_03405 [Candidatus Kaiserbacteria bacterium RIFCSPHIGHO2_01_FULL_54_36b]